MPGEYRDIEILRRGGPASGHRIFGWAVLCAMAAFLVNNVLEVGFGLPGLSGLFSSAANAWVPALVYAVAIAIAVAHVLRTSSRTLRMDAQLIHNFNIYLIRALFFAVLFVGIADALIALLRTESLLEPIFGQDMARNLGRANWVGPWIHMPLVGLGFVVALFTRTLGFTWLALLIVVAELLIVISRFVFSYEQALMSDLVRYWYAALFLFASAYTLFDEGHVRVDLLYASFARTRKGTVNAIGTVILGMATCWVILAICFNGKQSIVNAPVINFEVSQAGPFGMYAKYQMAAFISLFAVTMMIEFVSYYLEAVADHRDEPGHRNVDSPAAH